MPDIHSFGVQPITCHAFNADRTQIALSPNNNEVHIYSYVNGKWEFKDSLVEHVQRVTGVDWAAKSNTIVTCGADRDAYVWVKQEGRWKPTLVLLRINRAATCVKWSPKENKFAVGSAARIISVCHFEVANDWWVCKQIKKPIRSSVTCLDWHPNNILLAAGSSDFKARVFSGYVKEIEDKPSASNWGKKMPFGNLMAEFSSEGDGWVTSISFTASGERLGWVSHASNITIVDASNEQQLYLLRTNFLPFTSCLWLTESSLVVAGHDCSPLLFSINGSGELSFVSKLEDTKQAQNTKFSAMKHFRNLDSRAQSTESEDTKAQQTHQNTIMQVGLHSGDKANVGKFSTSGMDGRVVIWDCRSLEALLSGLKIV